MITENLSGTSVSSMSCNNDENEIHSEKINLLSRTSSSSLLRKLIPDLRVEQTRDTELLLGDSEGELVVVKHGPGLETLHGAPQQPGPEVVDEGAECDPVPPAQVHVQDVDILIARSHPSTPDLGQILFKFYYLALTQLT